jgi:predicted cupin superfamily sugar epimerase
MKDSAYWIGKLQLIKHPEGGYYRETYRAAESIPQGGLPPRFNGPRVFSTAIYFLLPSEECSALHRIKSDEVWHFHAGSPLTIHVIDQNGAYTQIKLGGDSFQAVVRAGCWFGATVDAHGSYALAGCTVAPGFDFADFELAKRADLLSRHPQHRAIIERLTR